MTKTRQILVGVVGAPHGVRGAVRLKSYTQLPMSLAGHPVLWTEDGRRLRLTGARHLKDDMLVGQFEGVDGRDAAQALTNVRLYVARADLPEPDADEFYHADLIGLGAFGEDGRAIGTVLSLQNFGAGDLLEIAPASGETFYVPFTRAFVPLIDVAHGRLVVAEQALAEETSDADPSEGRD